MLAKSSLDMRMDKLIYGTALKSKPGITFVCGLCPILNYPNTISLLHRLDSVFLTHSPWVAGPAVIACVLNYTATGKMPRSQL